MDEITILYKILHSLRIEDVDLYYDNGELIATDSMDNEWHGKEFYEFLVNETFVFQNNGSVLGVQDDLLSEFKKYSKRNGVYC